MILERLQQIVLEDTYNKNQVRDYILKDLEDSNISKEREIAFKALYSYFDMTYSYESKNARLAYYVGSEKFDIDKLIDEILVIILSEERSVQIQSVVGKLAPFFDYKNPWDGVKTAAEVLVVACESDLYDIIPAKFTTSGSIEVMSRFVLSPETKNAISEFQYLPPLICKPNKIYHNFQSAYFTKNDSIILGKGNHHEEPQALDVINILNQIPLSLDINILKFEEISKKPLDTIEKKRAWQKLTESSKKIYNQLLDLGNKFFLSWKYDKRGRAYSLGYHVNIQSSEYKKALIDFNKKEIIPLDD